MDTKVLTLRPQVVWESLMHVGYIGLLNSPCFLPQKLQDSIHLEQD